MGDGNASLVWFAAPGFRVLGIDDDGVEVVVEVETDTAPVACPVRGAGCSVARRIAGG